MSDLKRRVKRLEKPEKLNTAAAGVSLDFVLGGSDEALAAGAAGEKVFRFNFVRPAGKN